MNRPHYSQQTGFARAWGLTLVALIAWLSGVADAAVGDVDVRFGSHGLLEFPDVSSGRVLPLPDGKLLLVGAVRATNLTIDLRRYLASGAPDPSFGTAGRKRVQLPVGTEPSFGDAQLQQDGKILVVGAGGIGAEQWVRFIARIDANGALDATFGAGGVVNGGDPGNGFDGFGPGYSRVLVLPSGDLAALINDPAARFLDRFDADGRLIATTAIDGNVVAVASHRDDKVLLLTHTLAGSKLTRLLRDGRPDPTFASGRGVEAPLADALAVAADTGDVVVCGAGELRRLTADGMVDTAFGTTGMGRVRFIELPGLDGLRCEGVVVGGDGGVVAIASKLGGWTGYSSVTKAMAFDADGRPDPRVGAGMGHTTIRGPAAPGTKWRGLSQWFTPNGDLRLDWQVLSLTGTSLAVEAIDLGAGGARGSVGIPGKRIRVMEQTSLLELPVVRSGLPAGAASVRYEVVHETAAADDHGALSGELVWADGDRGTQTLRLSLVNDARIEGEETLLVRLFDAVGVDTPADPFTVTIVDDDALRSLRFEEETIIWTTGPTIPVSSWPEWRLTLDGGARGPVTAYFLLGNGIDGCCIGVLQWQAGEGGTRRVAPYAGESLGDVFYISVIDDDFNDAGPSAIVKVVIDPVPPDASSAGGSSGGGGNVGGGGGSATKGGGGSFDGTGVLLLLVLVAALATLRSSRDEGHGPLQFG